VPSQEAVATNGFSPQARRRAFGEPGGCFLWFKIWLVAMASWEGTICSCALPGSRRNQWFQPPGSPPSFWRAWGLLFLGLGCLQPPGPPPSLRRAWGLIFHVSSSLFCFQLPGPPPSFRRAWGLISMPFGIPSCLQPPGLPHTASAGLGAHILVLSSSLVLSQPPDLPFHRWQVWGLLPLGLWAFLGFQPPSLPLGFGQAGVLTLMYLAFWAQSPPGPPPLCFEWRAWGWLIAT